MRRVGALLLLCFAPLLFAANDAVVFSPPPGDLPATAYRPLVDLVAKSSGKKIVIQPASNFAEYAKNMRGGNYDLAFDGAQFAAWRIARLGHLPIARVPGTTHVVIAVRTDGPVSLDEIATGRKVCVLPPPELTHLAFQMLFTNPARQPHIVQVAESKELITCLRNKRADAAVFPSSFWEGQEKSELRTITFPEHDYPERTITLSGKFDADARAKISAALLSDEGSKALAPLLKDLRTDKLMAAQPNEYEGIEGLLQGSWGFQ